jgi:hypothetical protein
MSSRLDSLADLFVHIYALALRFYPDRVQGEYAAEMQAVFCMRVADAARQGTWRLFILVGREVRDLPIAVLSAHLDVLGGRLQPFFPSTSDQTSWIAALLSLLPFFIAGPLRIILSYQPGWMPREGSLLYLLFLLLSSLVVASVFVLGAVKKFPRWSYPYAVYLAFAFYLLAGYALYLFHWSIFQNNFFLFLAVILFVLWLPGFRWFYRNILRDWTLLTYGLYGLVLYLLASLDYDESPSLSLFVLLPSLLALGSALAHLRIRSAFLRIVALLAGTFAGLFCWLLPISQGMISVWIGAFIMLFMLLAFGIILAAILMAPMWLIPAIQSWRASRASQA